MAALVALEEAVAVVEVSDLLAQAVGQVLVELEAVLLQIKVLVQLQELHQPHAQVLVAIEFLMLGIIALSMACQGNQLQWQYQMAEAARTTT